MKLNSLAILAVSVASVALGAGCASASAPDSAASGSDLSASASPDWFPVMDDCVQVAVSAAAVKAFGDSNLQHLESLSVDGDLATDGDLTVTITTGNDEDGDTTRKVEVAQKVNTNTGKITCKVTKIDGKATSPAFNEKALKAIVDDCTGVAIVAAQKISSNYWHLYGLKLDGDPAQSGDLKYVVTQGNDEDGDTDYNVDVKQTIDLSTGKSTCKVTSAKEAPRQ
jgi:hypothetical protein